MLHLSLSLNFVKIMNSPELCYMLEHQKYKFLKENAAVAY